MARPKIDIDPVKVKQLAEIGCKVKEIAVLLECSEDTLHRRFAAELIKGRERLKQSLRMWQIQSAQKGNIAMLIWLGKQYLDQSEKIETEVTTKEAIICDLSWADEDKPKA